MSYYMASVNAYDALEEVHINVTVRQAGDSHESPVTSVLHLRTVVQSVGEPEPREWLRDALVALLEAI